MEDDSDLPNGNRFQRSAYRLLMRTVNSPRFTKFKAEHTPEKMRERREERFRLAPPALGIIFVIVGLIDFKSSFGQRMVAAAIGFALLWLSRNVWRKD